VALTSPTFRGASLADLFPSVLPDGTTPGHERRYASLYRIAIRTEDEGLLVESDHGLVPLGAGEHASEIDAKTPEWLRQRVLRRDGHGCRCCGSRFRLMVHHG
jgi:hypothetical protein